ncbi:M14 family zinc carboxypeptidase [Streptosporangium sp. 'caverna']|uniref:OmpL47-type beta-barrel domain-containing protein n=1 Tax=Streptosporangium sp. 'caverna' TaxID=2202249 RepID=UPI000D7D8DBD|nr:M14 family zinc carboxypeptidase [Streptosporangium sp. 'caverna']AWS47403.1 zinc carboxypeptidase [Streptosporangium sp. 'caverna']
MRRAANSSRVRRFAVVLALPLAIAVSTLPVLADPGPPPVSDVAPDRLPATDQNGVALIRIVVPDQADVDRLADMGVDLAEYKKPVDDGLEVHAILSPQEADRLRDQGFDLRGVISDESDFAANKVERGQALAREAVAEAETDKLTVLRAEWFTSTDNQRFLSVEVKSSATDAQTVLTATWDSGKNTAPDSGGTATMSRFTDAGQYMYHRFTSPLAIDQEPAKVTITSSRGGSVTAEAAKWLGAPRKAPRPHYVSDFVDHYMDATEVTDRIVGLAAEFPATAEIVDLPYKTNGYRRLAQAQFGTGSAAIVYLSSKAYGSEGGNDVTAALVNPNAADSPLSVGVNGKNIVVNLATNATGAITSTAKQVVDAVNASPAASTLVTASTYRGNAGAGVVVAAPTTRLTDFLKAPASVSRAPFQMKALRIGKHRDGSKVGVFLYCQEHAREWVTPLTCVETAERLLRNYAQDKATKKLVDNLDIFLLPTANPDGSHYSMYDYNMQRKNLTNHCAATAADPANRNAWGVDLNRNFSVGSLFDGYSGASATCTGETYAGPGELSEPESRNEVWLTQQYPNIKFAMNTHSYGGYFMWPPGAYKSAGRELLPRVDYGTENYFWEASDHILSAVQDYRGTAIWPGRTGPVPDVLYSAAGNSADEHWFNRGIIGWDFEVGADLYNPVTKRFTAVGFQPPFSEGHEEAMEFTNGQIAILEVARAFTEDRDLPESKLKVTAKNAGSSAFTFRTDEPANVYYTLDGSRPTLNSPKLVSANMREGAQQITVDKTTEVSWFSVDIAGNVENGYQPDGSGQNYKKETVEVKAVPVTTATTAPAEPASGWFTGPVSVTLSAAPGERKIDRTEYQLDGGAWTKYTAPIAVTGNGSHTLAYRSVDSANNVEAAKTLTVKVDTTAPVTTAAVGTAVNGGVPVTLSATDETSGVAGTEHSLDGGAWTPSAGTVTVSGQGEHELRFRSTDKAGNVEEIKAVTVPVAPEIAMTVTAQARCVDTSAYVAVTAVNDASVPVNVTLSTLYGSRTVADVTPGKQAYQSFNARTGQLAAGTVNVTGAATIGDRQVTSSYDAAHPAISCV